MKKKYLVIAVLIIVLVALVVFLYVFRKSKDSVEGMKPDFVMSSNELVSAFESDEKIANDKYVNKIIEVSGVIAEINDDSAYVTYVLRDDNAFSGVSCSIKKSKTGKQSEKKYEIGDSITLKGICNGFLMDVVLNKGTVVKP